MPPARLLVLTIVLALIALPAAAQKLDTTPRIAVMSAFPPEIVALRAATADAQAVQVNGVTFTTGMLEGQPVVLFLSGVSIVNAAMTTQLALERFEVSRIVFSGIAGGVDPALNIGDVVIADQWGQYLEVAIARAKEDGFAPPPFFEYPYGNFGMFFPRSVSVVRDGAAEPERRFWFPVDPAMMAAAESLAGGIDLADCTGDDACLSADPTLVLGGNGVSGGAFVDNAEFRAYAFETFEASVLDMESAAVAHVAYANDTPFIAIRSLSDLAGGGDGENEIGTFFGLAADNSATVVRALLRALES